MRNFDPAEVCNGSWAAVTPRGTERPQHLNKQTLWRHDLALVRECCTGRRYRCSGLVIDNPRKGFLKFLRERVAGWDFGNPE
jgi:hypothetical protein